MAERDKWTDFAGGRLVTLENAGWLLAGWIAANAVLAAAWALAARMIFVYLSAGFLLGLSIVAIVAYARAVVHGHRMLTHVVFAWGYVLVVTVIGVLAVSDEGQGLRWALAGANTVGALAMLNVVGRYRR